MLKTSRGIKWNPVGKLNFPGFQEILDFTATGSEASVSVAVDGDVDKEYKILCFNPNTTQGIYLRLNNDATSGNYGMQFLQNSAGSISSGRSATLTYLGYGYPLALTEMSVLTPSGFIKTAFQQNTQYTSGTTIGLSILFGRTYTQTSNITTIDAVSASGNFTAGTRIYVGVRRSN